MRQRWKLLSLGLAVAVMLAACAMARAEVESASAPEVTWRDVDGGPSYYESFDPSLPTSADFFPVAVWFASVVEPSNVERDRATGINTYVELTANSDLSLLDEQTHAVVSWDDPLMDGYVVSDEVDMWAGPGYGEWTGNFPGEGAVCGSAGCGFTIMADLGSRAPANALTYANYGKGVSFWQSDADAKTFVNQFQDVVSVDNYWFTDPNICGSSEGGTLVGGSRDLTEAECRRAANYGWTVDRVRSLVDPVGSKPVWAFVEVGHPAGEDWAPTIHGRQIRAAVWSSLIHGARGIIYFNHNFGGDCLSQNVLRDRCGDSVRPWVTALNRQIADLAPALNAPFLDGAVAADGPVDTAVKVDGDTQYLFAAARENRRSEVSFTLRCARSGTVTVIDEGRTIPLDGGTFADFFEDGDDVHLYRYDHAADEAPGCERP